MALSQKENPCLRSRGSTRARAPTARRRGAVTESKLGELRAAEVDDGENEEKEMESRSPSKLFK